MTLPSYTALTRAIGDKHNFRPGDALELPADEAEALLAAGAIRKNITKPMAAKAAAKPPKPAKKPAATPEPEKVVEEPATPKLAPETVAEPEDKPSRRGRPRKSDTPDR